MKRYSLNGNFSLVWLGLCALLFLAGCAPTVKERPRFFWPPDSGLEKIEYIDFYQADTDVRRKANTWMTDALLGTTQPQPVFIRPQAIVSDGKGRVFVADSAAARVYVYDFVKFQVRTLKKPDNSFAPLQLPMGLAVDQAGQVYVSDSQANKIFIFGADEKLRGSFSHPELQRPTGLTVDEKRQRLYVTDTGDHKVLAFSLRGELLQSLGKRGAGPGEFNFPLDVAVDDQGSLFVLDSLNARVQVFDSNGEFVRQFGERGTAIGSFQIPKALAVSPSGLVYVTDSQTNRFIIFDRQGQYLLTIGALATVVDGRVTPGGFAMPTGIDVDGNDTVWVADSLNRMFHRFQYLSEAYLREHPILPGQAFQP